MDVGIGAAELAIHIAQERRGEEDVVERGVESLQQALVARLHPDGAKGLLPLCASRGGDGVEIPCADLGPEIPARVLDADSGERHARYKLLSGLGLEIKVALQVRPPSLLALDLLLVGDQPRGIERTRKLQHEEVHLVPAPAPTPAEAADRPLVFDGERRIGGPGAIAPPNAVPKVENDMAVRSLWESIAVHPHAGSSRKLSVDLVVRQEHAVVARTRFFLFVRKPGAVALPGFLPSDQLQFAHGRHEQHVPQVADAGARQVVVREAHDRGVRIVVSGRAVLISVVRAAVARVWGDLDHAKGHCGPRENVAVLGGPDHRLGVVRERRARQMGSRQQDACTQRACEDPLARSSYGIAFHDIE